MVRPQEETIQLEDLAALGQALRNCSNPRYVPRWSRHLSSSAALGDRHVAGLPVTHEDRPVGPVHRLCRAWPAGSLLASRGGPRLCRDVQTLCASDQGLTYLKSAFTIRRDSRSRPRNGGHMTTLYAARVYRHDRRRLLRRLRQSSWRAPFIPAVAAASASSPALAGRTWPNGRPSADRDFPREPRDCTQRGCTGTIVDGYCDVCGSPAGAPPFIPAVAAASAAAPALAARTGLTAGGGGSGFPARPRNCTQRGCIGTIVDGYCDVCGSPAGAPPFIPAVAAAQQPNVAEEESPTQRIPRVQVPTELPSAQEMADPAAADPEEESPTQRIPRVQMTTELPSAQEMADPAAADPEEESPTQRIPRVQVPQSCHPHRRWPTQQLPTRRKRVRPSGSLGCR